ncbi:ribosome recycling factor [Candidatus Peregrinibacteria bacterium]|nr:ribosome recycling factor [Candidatus Peregrinibacteria bacterium]
MTSDQALNVASQEFEKAVNHLKDEFNRLQLGRANPAMVENVHVEIYGSIQPIKAVASISVPEPRTLVIAPWDRSVLAAIEKGIVGSGLGLNPVNDGIVVRINIPPLTEERRRDLTKVVKKLSEEARISVRTARHDAHDLLKGMEAKSEITEDDLRTSVKKLQDNVDAMNKRIDELAKQKEQDVMTV